MCETSHQKNHPYCALLGCAAQAEPVAWRDPSNGSAEQGCTYDKAVAEKWPHIFSQPLYTTPPAPVQAVEPLTAWQPRFEAMSHKQETLAVEFCAEIAGPRGQPGNPPDPVRLLEMAQALYEAERDDFAAAPPLPETVEPCRVNPAYAGPSNCNLGTVGCTKPKHRSDQISKT